MTDDNEVVVSEKVKANIINPSSESVMDFSDFWNMLVRWKTLVFLVALVTISIIAANAFLNKPIPLYKATTYLSAPTENDIKGFKRVDYPPAKFFTAFIENLKSITVRREYFNKNNLFDQLALNDKDDEEQIFEEQFNQMFSVVRQGENVYFSFDGKNAKLTADWVNGLAKLANNETIRSFLQEILATKNKQLKVLQDKINNLKSRINNSRKVSKWERESLIFRLEEMALIAERLGVKGFTSKSNVYKPGMPLYLRGAQALRVEARVLRERKSDDPFIKDIRDWKLELATLQPQFSLMQVEFNKLKFVRPIIPNVSTMQVRQMATASSTPYNMPVFIWVLLTGLLSSLTLGVLAAFFADFVVSSREKE